MLCHQLGIPRAFARGAQAGVLITRGTDRGHHLIEGSDELRISVPDQELEATALVFELGGEVTSLPRDSRAHWMRADAGEEHLEALKVDKENVRARWSRSSTIFLSNPVLAPFKVRSDPPELRAVRIIQRRLRITACGWLSTLLFPLDPLKSSIRCP